MKQMEGLIENLAALLKNIEARMKKTQEAFQKNINNIRSTRASASMLDAIQVDYYGTKTPINQLASVSVPEARVLLINPYDRNALPEIEKSLLKGELGITPQTDGNVIRLVMPELSGERRQELVKQLKARLEETKVSLRNSRREANEELKKYKTKGLSEDEMKSKQLQIQKMTDLYIKQCEAISEQKEKAILTV